MYLNLMNMSWDGCRLWDLKREIAGAADEMDDLEYASELSLAECVVLRYLSLNTGALKK